MNNSSAPGDVADAATPRNDNGAPSRAGEEGSCGGTSRPPRGVFDALGVMELEHRCNVRMTTDPFLTNAPANQQDDDISSVETDGHDAFYEDADGDAGGGFFGSWNTGKAEFFPTFGDKGKATNHESRDIDEEIQYRNLKPSGYDFAYPQMGKKKYSVVFALLIFFVVIISAVLIATGNDEDALASLETAGFVATDDEAEAASLAHQGPINYSIDYHAPSHEAIKPSAMTTIKRSAPDAKTGGMLHFSVEGDERISFVRFELPSVSGDEELTKATLNLYLISHHEAPVNVSIEALPHGGIWSDFLVSWNDQMESRDSMYVDSFEAIGLKSSDKKQLYEVDVSSAITSKSKRITFKLSTESSSRMDFAGKKWNGGEAVPELILTLSK